MKKLLAIIFNGEQAREHIKYVMKMSVDLKSGIHFLYILSPVNYQMVAPDSAGVAIAETMDNFRNIAENNTEIIKGFITDIKNEMSKDLRMTCSYEIGQASLVTQRFLKDNAIDLVVLEGEKNESIWTNNSANMEIIRNVDRPVWILPHGSVYKSCNQIVYATDYKEEDIPTLNKLIELTGACSPCITALHVTDSPDFNERIMKTGFQEMVKKKTDYKNISVTTIMMDGNKALDLILDFALSVNADVIVILKENRHFFEHIFKSSSTKTLIHKSDLPVLVYHER